MILESLISERDILRDRWRVVRSNRLELKNSLIKNNGSIIEARHNYEYRKLKKEQRYISTMIKHIENKISRVIKNGA